MLTSLQNPLVKRIRKLHRGKYRRQQRQFLLEGTHLIEAAYAVNWPLEVVCYTTAWQQQQSQVWSLLQGYVPRLESVSVAVLNAIATTVHPEGVVAVARSPQQDQRSTTSPASTTIVTQLGLVLERIQDPGNLGTLMRTAAAVGADRMLMSTDCVDPENPKVLRASAGAWFQIPHVVYPDLQDELHRHQHQGGQVVATTPTAPQDYWQLDFRPPTLILVGNEGTGLSASLLELADQRVKIPLVPGVESLNAAIAATLVLYEVRRQRLRDSVVRNHILFTHH